MSPRKQPPGAGLISPLTGVRLLGGDAYQMLTIRADASVDRVVISTPYRGMRGYGFPGHYGRESIAIDYITNLRHIFTQRYRALAPTGAVRINLSDRYNVPAHIENKRHHRTARRHAHQ